MYGSEGVKLGKCIKWAGAASHITKLRHISQSFDIVVLA